MKTLVSRGRSLLDLFFTSVGLLFVGCSDNPAGHQPVVNDYACYFHYGDGPNGPFQTVLSTRNGAVLDSVPMDALTVWRDFDFTPDGKYEVYVEGAMHGTGVRDMVTGDTVAWTPAYKGLQVAVAADSKLAVVGGGTAPGIFVFTLPGLDSIWQDTIRAQATALLPDSAILLYSKELGGYLYRVGLSAPQLAVESVQVADLAYIFSIVPEATHGRVYLNGVRADGSPVFIALSEKTLEVIAQHNLPAEFGAGHFVVSPNGNDVYLGGPATAEGANALFLRYNVATKDLSIFISPGDSIYTGPPPRDLAVTPDGTVLAAAVSISSFDKGGIVLIDLQRRKVIGEQTYSGGRGQNARIYPRPRG